MKKILLFGLAFGQIWALSAQTDTRTVTMSAKDGVVKEEATQPSTAKIKKIDTQIKQEKAAGSVQLGITSYDLQTNATVHDRIANNYSGNISVAWTASEENSSSFTDRGTGYSTYDETSGTWTLSPEYPRIESQRCGWPSILYDGNGGEIIVSHGTAPGSEVLKINTRSSIGTGNWSEKDINPNNYTWNRATMGGMDGNSLHIIAATDADDSAMYQDMTSALVYFRSQDGGQTFDINGVLLPDMDSATFGSAVSNDAYAIVADGNHIAIGLFNSWNDVTLWESTDNGTNWTRTAIETFPFRGFDEFDAVVDTNFYVTCDGSGAIIIDNNGVVHMTWGRMQASMGMTPDDGRFQRRYFTDSLGYYRHSSPALLSTVAPYVDANGDNTINITKFSDYGFASVNSMPNMGQGNDDRLYIVYSGANDTILSAVDDETNLRNLWLIYSDDDGDTWTDPLNITHAPGEWTTTECVYPDIDRVIDDEIRILYHKDNLPAGYVRQVSNTNTQGPAETWQTGPSSNQVIFMRINLSLNIGIEKVLNNVEETDVYPNPSNGLINLTVRVIQDVDVTINVTDMNGRVVHVYNGQKLKLGTNNVGMDLSHLNKGMYFVNISDGESSLTEKVIIN